MSFIEGSEAFESEQGQEGVEGEELPPLSDYGKRFVESAPEEEREYAEKYVRQWDAGYAKQKQKWENEISQYRQLGDPQVLNEGVRLRNILLHEPERLLEYLVVERGMTPPQAKKAIQDAQDQENENDPYAEKFRTLEQQQQRLIQLQQEQYLRAQQEREQQEFVQQLEAARKKFGDYDQDFVLQRIISRQASSVDEAVQQYQSFVQQILQKQGRATAPGLLGSGAGSPQAKPVRKGPIPDNQVVDHLAALLEQGKHA